MNVKVVANQVPFEDRSEVALFATMKRSVVMSCEKMAMEIVLPCEGFATQVTKKAGSGLWSN